MTAEQLYRMTEKERREKLLAISGPESKRKRDRVEALPIEEVDKALATWLVLGGPRVSTV